MEFNVGYVFTNPDLLQQALTHSSFVYEHNLGTKTSNERLEFLGDAVLELLTSDYLYNRFPELTEGELTKLRAGLVCEDSLAVHARRLEIGKYLRLGRGEAMGGGAGKGSILSDALEAVIGAIYLDGGLEGARVFVDGLLSQPLNLVGKKGASLSDPKSSLQEEIQKKSRVPLVYEIIKEDGPAHQKEFTATVSHDGRILGTGAGKSKKDAEREAAEKALKRMSSR